MFYNEPLIKNIHGLPRIFICFWKIVMNLVEISFKLAFYNI